MSHLWDTLCSQTDFFQEHHWGGRSYHLDTSCNWHSQKLNCLSSSHLFKKLILMKCYYWTKWNLNRRQLKSFPDFPSNSFDNITVLANIFTWVTSHALFKVNNWCKQFVISDYSPGGPPTIDHSLGSPESLCFRHKYVIQTYRILLEELDGGCRFGKKWSCRVPNKKKREKRIAQGFCSSYMLELVV